MHLRRAIRRLQRMYAKRADAEGIVYNEKEAVEAARRRLAARNIAARHAQNRPLRIFWAGTAAEQDRSGFLQALETYGPVTCMVDEHGAYGYRSVSSQPGALFDRELRCTNSRLLLEQAREAFEQDGLDLVMGQLWANFVDPDVLATIQGWGVATVNVSMDDRLPEHWRVVDGLELGSVGLRRGLDLVLTTTREVCSWYAVNGCPAVYWPLASDPTHFQRDSHASRDIDVCFVGNRYGIRGRIVDALCDAGVRVEAFGGGWPNGPVSATKSAELFGRSKIVLGVGTVGHASDVYTIKLRDFDAPMSGALYITHRNPDLLELYDQGREIVCYESIEECVAQVTKYLADEPARMRIAAAGASRARRDHSWSKRLYDAFVMLGFRSDDFDSTGVGH